MNYMNSHISGEINAGHFDHGTVCKVNDTFWGFLHALSLRVFSLYLVTLAQGLVWWCTADRVTRCLNTEQQHLLRFWRNSSPEKWQFCYVLNLMPVHAMHFFFYLSNRRKFLKSYFLYGWVCLNLIYPKIHF